MGSHHPTGEWAGCKPCNTPQALRPICLQHPVNKVVSGILIQHVMHHAFPKLRNLPLYAYLPARNTTDCLLLVSQHCHQVRASCQTRHTNLDKQSLTGGLQFSLDMEKAFDSISRDVVIRALQSLSIPEPVAKMVQSWLSPHKYFVPFKDLVGSLQANRGIQQGSKGAPILWTLCMSLIMMDLLARFNLTWLYDHLIVFADDVNLRCALHTPQDGFQALTDLSFVLNLLKSYGLRINITKSVSLCRVIGQSTSSFLKSWVCRTKTGPKLRVPELEWQIPLVAKTGYLGITVSYRAWETDTIQRRVAATNHNFSILRRWLAAPVVPLHLRFRLYNQGITPTLLYGVFEIGVVTAAFKKFSSVINMHYRRIYRSPVHLTHESTRDFCQTQH